MYSLFCSPGACALAPHIVLEEAGATYELVLCSTRDGKGTGAADYLALNPKGRVPALLGVPGRAGGAEGLLTEASAILVYLARAFPEICLLPGDPAGDARCVEWPNWLSDTVHAMSLAQLWRPQRFVSDPTLFPAVTAKGRENLLNQYAFVEGILGDGRLWGVPSGYTVVDPFLLVSGAGVAVWASTWKVPIRPGRRWPRGPSLAMRSAERWFRKDWTRSR